MAEVGRYSRHVAVMCPMCGATVEDVAGRAWKCHGTPAHYFNVYPICGECGYTTMYVGHAPGCAQIDGADG